MYTRFPFHFKLVNVALFGRFQSSGSINLGFSSPRAASVKPDWSHPLSNFRLSSPPRRSRYVLIGPGAGIGWRRRMTDGAIAQDRPWSRVTLSARLTSRRLPGNITGRHGYDSFFYSIPLSLRKF